MAHTLHLITQATTDDRNPETALPGHDHWNWRCPKEIGGCGYASPWYSPTKAAARAGLYAHLETCTAPSTSASTSASTPAATTT